MKCYVCGMEYEGQHLCPNVHFYMNGLPYNPLSSIWMWYVCPNCHGGFNYWDYVQGEGSIQIGRCPFCGMEKGKYPKAVEK